MTAICEDLRKAALQAAIQGKLTEQLPSDRDAEDLYQAIQKEKQALIKAGKLKKEKPLPEISEDEIPFDIPESWKWVRLNEIYNFIDYRGKTPKKTGAGVFLVTASNVRKGYLDFTRKEYISDSEYKTRQSRGITHKGDILFTTEAPMGNAAICDIEVCSCGQRTITFQQYGKTSLQNQVYVDFILSPYFQEQLLGQCTGTTAKGIKAEKLKSFLIPLPPLSEQQRIVAKVDELMAKIKEAEKTEKQLVELYKGFPDDMKASLLQAAIQGKLTEQQESDGDAEALYQEIQKEKQALVKAKKTKKEKPLPEISDDEIPFDIPENWKWVRLGSIGCMQRGSGIKKSETTPIGPECVRYGEIYTSYSHSFTATKSHTSESVYSNCIHIKKDDLLFTLTGENKPDIAKTIAYLGDSEVAVGGDLAVWTHHGCDARYLSYYMATQYAISQKVEAATGDIIVHISCDKVGMFLMPLPPLAEQQRIVEKLDQLLPLCGSMTSVISGGETK